jgi:phosphoribosylamine--glycine ligase
MKIAIVGSGAREHVMVQKCIESNVITEITTINMNYFDVNDYNKVNNVKFDYDVEDYKKQLADLFIKLNIELVIIGPEKYLVDGLVDYLVQEGFKCFGPNANAAQLEGSKCFSKEIMNKYGFATSPYCVFSNAGNAKDFLKNNFSLGFSVIKVSGLAGGKGVCVCDSIENGNEFINAIFVENRFGKDNHKILIEKKLVGQEVSLMGFCNGWSIEFLDQAQDYKRLHDGDKGVNTGGMGAICPVNLLNDVCLKDLKEKCDKLVTDFEYIGVLYLGILIDNKQPFLLEFNCRLGDPEAQVLLENLSNDFGQVINDCMEGTKMDLELKDQVVMNVVCAHQNYTVGKLEEYPVIHVSGTEDINVYYADPARKGYDLTSRGGRTLSVVGTGRTYGEAYQRVYKFVTSNIKYDGLYYRTDIGLKFVIPEVAEKRKYRFACIGEHIIEEKGIVLNIISEKDILDPETDVMIMPTFNGERIINILKSYDVDYIIYNGSEWSDELLRKYYDGCIFKYNNSGIYRWCDGKWRFFAITRLDNMCCHIWKYLDLEPLKYPVNIEEGNKLVDDLKSDSDGKIGDFCAKYMSGGTMRGYACDGIGTKLDLALEYGKLDTIGIDLVAMNVNDLIVCGIKPEFFLDYIAIDRMDKDMCNTIIRGVKDGCTIAGCELIGGETAEMTGIYMNGKFDVAGFAMGESIMEEEFGEMSEGDILVGFPSNGIHSNGFSLVRKLLKYYDLPEGLSIDDFLVPTKIYNCVLSIIKNYRDVALGFAHITGGGIVDNLPRILPSHLTYKITEKYIVPKIFRWIQEKSRCTDAVMDRTFNNGIGVIGVFKNDSKLNEIFEKYGCFKLGVLEKI